MGIGTEALLFIDVVILLYGKIQCNLLNYGIVITCKKYHFRVKFLSSVE